MNWARWTWFLPLMFAISCAEDESTLAEISISAPKIVKIDDTGAEFYAAVSGFTSEDILEYGFVYGVSSRPVYDTDFKVSLPGEPDESFQLKVTSDLEDKRGYSVVSFLRTASRIIYSPSTEFTSEGSLIFNLKSLIAPEEIYFGDTITLESLNSLQRYIPETKLFFNYQEVPFFVIDENTIGFTIPRESVDLGSAILKEEFLIGVQIRNQETLITLKAKFKEPVFESPREQKYDSSWEIRGEYFGGDPMYLQYVRAGEVHTFPIISRSDQLIEFRPDTYFLEKNPTLQLVLRQGTYPINQFVIEDSEVNPGQVFQEKAQLSSFRVSGSNLNLFARDSKVVMSPDPESIDVRATVISNNQLDFSMVPVGPFSGRTLEFSLVNFGQPSQNKFTVEYLNPSFPLMSLQANLGNQSGFAAFTQVANEALYLFTNTDIFEIDPLANRTTQVASLGGLDGYQTFSQTIGLKIYFSAFDEYSADGTVPFYVFDALSKSVLRLKDIPTVGRLAGSFVKNDRLYVHLFGASDGVTNLRQFVYDPLNDTWEETLEGRSFFVGNYSAFETNEALYVLGNGYNTSGNLVSGLFKWNEGAGDWVLEWEVPTSYYPARNRVAELDGFIYFHENAYLYQLSILDGTMKRTERNYSLKTATLASNLGELYGVGQNATILLYRIDGEYFQ